VEFNLAPVIDIKSFINDAYIIIKKSYNSILKSAGNLYIFSCLYPETNNISKIRLPRHHFRLKHFFVSSKISKIFKMFDLNGPPCICKDFLKLRTVFIIGSINKFLPFLIKN